MRFLNRAHRVAAFCGAAPLALATVIFLLWLVTRQVWLMVAGLFLLYAGLGAFVLGIGCAVKAWWTTRRDPDRSNRRTVVSIRACVLLLFASFPAAAGMVWAASTIVAQSRIIIRNDSRQQLSNVHVIGGGCDISFGVVPPHAIVTRSFRAMREGYDMTFRADDGTRRIDEPMYGDYLSPGVGGRETITVRSEGTISVAQKADLSLIDYSRETGFDIFFDEVSYWLDTKPCTPSDPSNARGSRRVANESVQSI